MDTEVTLLHEQKEQKETRCQKIHSNIGCQCILNLFVVLIIAGGLAGILYAIVKK